MDKTKYIVTIEEAKEYSERFMKDLQKEEIDFERILGDELPAPTLIIKDEKLGIQMRIFGILVLIFMTILYIFRWCLFK